jgi:uncharacterized protein YecE (DUF72 family)
VPEFVALARKHGAAIVLADSEKYPLIADATAGFVYMRLQRTEERVATGYTARALKQWTERAATYQTGGIPDDLPALAKTPASKAQKKRDVFVYFISGAKVRAPAAALALLTQLK